MIVIILYSVIVINFTIKLVKYTNDLGKQSFLSQDTLSVPIPYKFTAEKISSRLCHLNFSENASTCT